MCTGLNAGEGPSHQSAGGGANIPRLLRTGGGSKRRIAQIFAFGQCGVGRAVRVHDSIAEGENGLLHRMNKSPNGRRISCGSMNIYPPDSHSLEYICVHLQAEDREKAAVSYARLVAAMETLGFTDVESRNLWAILAAIYHLGVAGAIRGTTNRLSSSSVYEGGEKCQTFCLFVEKAVNSYPLAHWH